MGFPLSIVSAEKGERPCGECQACCTAIGVHELNKPPLQRCQHQCDSGCAIYEARPESCRGYYCLWQAGFLEGDERRRPDKLGIILDSRSSDAGDVISAWEIREGAADEPATKYLLEKIGTKFVVYVRRYNSNKRRVIGPPERLSGMRFEEYT